MQASREPLLDSITTEIRPRGTASFPWLLLAIVVVAIAVFFGGGWLTFSPRYTPEQRRALALQEVVKHNNQFASFADAARAKADWIDAQNGLKRLLEDQQSIASAARELEQLLKDLETSEAGRRIAADPAAVAKLVALRDEKRLTEEELDGFRRIISELSSIADKALKDSVALAPDREFNDRFNAIESSVAKWGTIAANLSALKTLIADTSGAAPADGTLEEAVQRWQAERDREHLAELAAAREQLDAEMNQRKEIETIEAERKSAEARLRTEAAEADMRALRAEARSEKEQAIVREAQEKIAAVRARFALESEFQAALPEIRSLLSPAISRGRMQLGGESFGWYQGEEGPLSLAQLKRFGTLQPGKEALLGTLFCGPTSPNDRPFGSFPERVSYSEGKIKRAQDLLIKYGELMVEHGLLNP